jgi:hypothetical protein
VFKSPGGPVPTLASLRKQLRQVVGLSNK